MIKSAFLKINDVIKFIDGVFGEGCSFVIEGADELIRSEGRRAEDLMSTRTFLEQRSSPIVFSITFSDGVKSGGAAKLPAVFSNPDYNKVLRNKYRELNRTEIQYWKIDYNFSRTPGAKGDHHQVVVRFTVMYGGEN